MGRLLRLAMLCLGACVLLSASPARAQTQPIFGPFPFTLPDSQTHSFSNSFDVPASATGPYLLRVQLSAPNSLTALTFKLNNAQVMGLADFAGGKTLVEKSVVAQLHNTIFLQLGGRKGTVITVTVFATPNLPKPTSLAPNPLSLNAGAAGSLTATLSPAPTASGALAVASANGSIATVPASVPFAAGQAQVAIPVNGVAVGNTTVTASLNGGSTSATVNVTPAPPTIRSLDPSSLSVTQGGSGTLTVTLAAAQTTATSVALLSGNPGIASVPASVTVPAGQVSATFAVAAASPGSADITASVNGTSAVSHVTVTPAPPTVVSLLPAVSSVTLGASTTLTLTLSAAQSTDTTVPVAASPADIVSAPAQVVVPAGQTSVTVTIGTVAFGQAGVTATLNGSSASAVVNVVPLPVALGAIVPSTLTMNVGATSSFTVSINATQPANTVVALSADDPSVLQVPPSATIAQGQTSATFTATALSVGNAVITASANNTTKSASVHVSPQPAAIASLLPSALPLQQGATGSLTLAINVAQEADTSASLASSAPAVASVPASVTVPAGATSVSIPVTAIGPGSADISASLNGSAATSTVSVTPPPPVVTGVAPATLSLPKGTPGTLRVAVSRAPNAPTVVTLGSSDPAVASVPQEVNIPAGALFADFPVAANGVGQATISASLNGASATAQLTVAPAELVTLTLSPQTPTDYVGETVPFSATGTMTDGTQQDFTARVAWSSSNPAVSGIGASTGVATPAAAGQTTITASYSFAGVQTGDTITIAQSTVLTVKQPVALQLSAPVTTLIVGTSTTVTVTSADPAPPGGLAVTLTGSSGAGSFPGTVTIPEGGNQATFVFAAVAEGLVTVTAAAPNRLPGSLAFTVLVPFAIQSISPASGEVGTLVTLTGSGFDANAIANQLVFRGIDNTTVAAAPVSATPTTITVKVPPLADSGPIALTNTRGTLQTPAFTVVRSQDYQLLVSPASVSVYQAASNGAQVQLSSTGTRAFSGLVALSVQGLPSGVTPTFGPQTLSALQAGTITFGALATAIPGTYPITVSGEIKEGGASFTRKAAATLTILASAGVTGVKGRFVTPQGAGIAGVIVRADIATTPQPQTTTDPAGNFQLGGLPAGVVTLRFDATPANPLYPIWPQNVTVPAGKVLVMEDWVINPPPPDERFTPIVPASNQDQVVGDPRFPGLKITIPAGVTIIGWDGVPKTRMAVERLDPDKLPVAAPPIKTKSVYQLYFGTPMGGLPNPALKIPITLPNDLGLEPGKQTDLYYYDGSPMGGTGQWVKGGTGTVSADGSVIISDADSGIPRFCGVCGLPCFKAAEDEAPGVPCPDCDRGRQKYGKPVNLSTGQELDSAVDLVVDGEVPIVIQRVYNPFDAFAYVANFQQSLGVNWTLGGYDVAMLPFGGDYTLRFVMPGNARADFQRGSDGRFRSAGFSTFDGAEVTKLGGSNPSAFGFLSGGDRPPSGAPITPHCASSGATYIMKFKDGREWRFDDAPNATKVKIGGGCLYFLTSMTDAQGRSVQIERSDGRITRISTSSGQFVTMDYDTGVISRITDNLGRTVTYSHVSVPTKGGFRGFGVDSAGGAVQTEAAAISLGLVPIPPRRLVSAATPQGTYAYTYEDDPPSLRLGGLSFDSGAGGAISTEPTSCQNVRGGTRLKTIQLPGVQGVFTNYYGPSKRVLRQTWPDGTDIRFSYKVVGGCVPGLFSSSSQPTEGAPLTGGSATTTCQGAGCVRTDSWDGDSVTGGTVVGVEVTDSRGVKFSRGYNSAGLALKETDENGQVVTIERDQANPSRVTRTTDALGRVTSYEYDTRGNRTKIVDPAGRETSITYDAKWNKPTLVSRRLDPATVVEYRYSYDDATGVLLTSTDPEGNVTTYNYDVRSRLAVVIDPLTHSTRIDYDGQGNPAKITDALGNSVSMVSDSGGRVVQTSDALGNDTQASYNSLNQLTRITDSRAGQTVFNFDSRNNLASVVNALNKTIESYSYDAIGRLSAKTDAMAKSESYGYDGNGNLTGITDRRGQATTMTYNERNQPLTVTYQDGTVQARTYDAAGRLVEIREGDNSQRMEYDLLDRVTRVVTDSLAGLTSITYEYDNLDRRTKRTVAYPGGVLEETAYAYDKASRLLSITQSGVNGTQTTTYTWDAASRLSEKVLPNGVHQVMDYDDANRLVAITYKKTDDTVIEQVSYAYDANGQRTARSSGSPALQDTAFTATYDDANRMTSITLTAVGKTYNLGYDDHGNLIQKQNAANASELTTYAWDARNRLSLISMTDASGTSIASFKYDALGRRIERQISTGATSQRTQYVYDGIQAIGELVDGRLSATILTGLNIDEVIARTVNLAGGNPIATKTYLTDALGSVLAMTNQNQNSEIFYSFSTYGETTALGADLDSPANSNQYTARENDGLVGGTNGGQLYYYRARYYDPVLKRFLAEDPIGVTGGANVYAYVEGDPAGHLDPLGLWAFGDPLPDWMVNASAGFGDTLSFGLTNAARNVAGINGVVNKCTDAYSAGKYSAVALSLAFGAAHLGRAALNQGVTRVFSDPRGWKAVQATWSRNVGGYRGQYELHHWFTPQSAGGSNAGLNYMAVSPWLNNAMGNGGLMYNAFKGTVLGIYGAIPTAAISAMTDECPCK